MAKELTSGERQVFTTPSSLASRMGVVKGQSGDPVELATSELGKTLSFIGKQKAVQAEEKWKADVKVDSLKKISKMAEIYRYSPTDFINNATGHRDGLLESAPKAFKQWTRTYLAQLITTHSNQIIDATWKRDQKELLLKNTESNSSEMNYMSSLLLETPWQEHTKLFEEKFSAHLQDMIDSYTTVYNTIPTSERTGMPTPIEQGRIWKAELEQSRNLSIAQKMIMDAVEIDKQRISDGILVGDEISGWVGPSAVDDALKLVNEMMLQYEIHGITGRKEAIDEWKYLEAARPYDIDGPWSFLDLDQVERMAIKTNTIMHADNLVKQYKTESAALTNHQKTVLSNNIELATSGGEGAINDTFSLLDKESDVKYFIDTSLVGADQAQIDSVYDSWRTAKKIVSLFPQMLEKEATFDSNVESILTELKYDGINIDYNTRKEVELAIANHYVGHFLLQSTGSPYLNVSNVGFMTNDSGDVIGPTNELIAVGEFAKKFGFVHPQLKTIMQSAGNINVKENPNAIMNLAQVVGYIHDTNSLIPKNMKFQTWEPLLELYHGLQYLASDPQGTVMNKDFLIENYLMKVNPDATDLDERIERINRALTADTTWSNQIDDSDRTVTTFDERIKEELYKTIDKNANANLLWGVPAALREMLGFDEYPWKEMTDIPYKDRNMFMEDMLPIFKEFVIMHLAQSYGKAAHIAPSNIESHIDLAVQGAINELGNQGYMFEVTP